uniref:Exocyst complex component Sec8 n=1 Tax=Panagrellus redivivus TaxID=6233 RepID=A0A7E4VVQ5_PANRE
MKAADGLSSEESCGLLINVIRTLTTSASSDQKQIEKTRLEAGFDKSAKQVDDLLARHQKDVGNSLKTFRNVSTEITACRQRIHAVKNALAASKVLLQCRRDDLKKLWVEDAEQKCICNILEQIEEIKKMDVAFNEHIVEHRYNEAVDVLKKSDILLNGPLSAVTGLDQLRQHVSSLSRNLFETVVNDMLELLFVRPAESQMLELMKGMSMEQLNESVLCVQLREKYKENALTSSEVPTDKKLAECLASLAVFDQLMSALEQVFLRSKTTFYKSIDDTVTLLKIIMKESVADSSHLAQLIKVVVLQINASHEVIKVLGKELTKVGRYVQDINVEKRFWDAVLEVLQTLVMKHLDFYEPNPDAYDGDVPKTRALFRFDGTNCVSSYSYRRTAQPISSICKPNPYNIIPIFRVLDGLGRDIEHNFDLDKFSTFMQTFVMTTFIQRVHDDISAKRQATLSRGDVWSQLSSTTAHNVKVLSSSLQIYEQCEEVGKLVRNMERYTAQFALIWLDTIEAYAASAADTYAIVTKSRNTSEEGIIEQQKISAQWTADEDISRTLKSLPQWTLLNQANVAPNSFDPDVTPTSRMAVMNSESDKDVRARTEREAELLIANLAGKKALHKAELISDMDSIKQLIFMHESLLWFTMQMRTLIAEEPKMAQDMMKTHSIPRRDGKPGEQRLREALLQQLGILEDISETCLLMIHLELRVHCFYYLLPLAQMKNAQFHDEMDKAVYDFRDDMIQFHRLLGGTVVEKKAKCLFEGLGHLCASIFIHSSQHMTKLTESNKKRIIRDIIGVQQALSYITGRRESELDRAKTFFDLLNKDPEQLLALIMERGAIFSFQEYTFLISLAVRSDPKLSSEPGALDRKINQLRSILSQKHTA